MKSRFGKDGRLISLGPKGGSEREQPLNRRKTLLIGTRKDCRTLAILKGEKKGDLTHGPRPRGAGKKGQRRKGESGSRFALSAGKRESASHDGKKKDEKLPVPGDLKREMYKKVWKKAQSSLR